MLGRGAACLVRAYQLSIGRLLSPRCRFEPSCSHYAVEAFRTNGLLKGALQVTWRLVRCAPWGTPGFDPVIAWRPGPLRALAEAWRGRVATQRGHREGMSVRG